MAKNEVKGHTQSVTTDKRQEKEKSWADFKPRVAMDSTQEATIQGSFGHSGKKNVVTKIAGDHTTLPNKNSHTNNRGLDTLSDDSRNHPLAGTDKSYGMLDANAKQTVRITEGGDRLGTPNDPKGNVLRS